MLETVIVLVLTGVAVIAFPSTSFAGPRHLDHWRHVEVAEQADFANNSRQAKQLWASRRRIEAGTSEQTQPGASEQSPSSTNQSDSAPAEGDSEPANEPSNPKENRRESWKGLFKRIKIVFIPARIMREQASTPTQPVDNSKVVARNGGGATVQGDWSF